MSDLLIMTSAKYSKALSSNDCRGLWALEIEVVIACLHERFQSDINCLIWSCKCPPLTFIAYSQYQRARISSASYLAKCCKKFCLQNLFRCQVRDKYLIRICIHKP